MGESAPEGESKGAGEQNRKVTALRVISLALDGFTEKLGAAVAWLSLGMVLITLLIILLGLFDYGRIWLQDSVTYMHGILFMTAVGYTMLHEGHVRIDVFYGKFSPRLRAYVDMFGALFLLLPTLATICFYSWEYVVVSWKITEGAKDAGGLPGTFLLKTFILLFCLFGALQGASQFLKGLMVLQSKQLEAK